MTDLATLVANNAQATLSSRTGSYYLIDYYQSGDGTITLTGFGAVRDYLPALNRIQNLITNSGQTALVQLPGGVMGFSGTFNFYKTMHLRGTSMGINANSASPSQMVWPKNVTGIRCWDGGEVNTALGDAAYGPYPGPVGYTSAYGLIEDTQIVCTDDTTTSGHGVHISSAFRLNRVKVQGFGGDGVRIFAYNPNQGGINAGTGQADIWYISDSIIRSNKGNGLFVQGADTNAGVAHMVLGGNNSLWDFVDNSYLGNTYIGCQSDGGGRGSYKSTTANTYVGCYSESKASALYGQSFIVGGVLNSNFNTPSLEVLPYSQTFNAQTAVNSGSDLITLTSAATHFPVGYAVQYSSNGGTPIGGLVDGVTYYIKTADSTTVSLAATVGGATIDLTALGASATHSLSAGTEATAVVLAVDGSGAVTSILPLTFGNNYTSATVTVYKEGDGSGLVVTPNIVGGHITSYTIVSPGSGYVGRGQSPGLAQSQGGGMLTYAPLTAQNWNPNAVRRMESVLGHSGNQFFTGTVYNNGPFDIDADKFYLLRWNETTKGFEAALSGSAGNNDLITIRWPSNFATGDTMGRAGAIPPGSIQFPAGFWLGGGPNNSSTNGRFIGNGTAAPTTGQWARGDIVYNTTPTSGGFVGWVCVTTGDFAGTPPVFKTFGVIS